MTPAWPPRFKRRVNYRHHFHAGNFADLVKHAALTAALARLQQDPSPLLVIDTHAGAGAYALPEEALRTGEAAAARRLRKASEVPDVFAPLRTALGGDGAGFYPGSPWLIARSLREGDRLVACELRPDDHAALVQTIGAGEGREVLCTDGYAEAAARLAALPERALVLVDPPYERADDYDRVVALLAETLCARSDAVVLVWAPLKDLETFDRFLRSVEVLNPPSVLVAEVRLRPLADPMRMNGCAVLVLNDPGLEAPLTAACAWVAETLGEPGGEGRVWRLA